MRYQVVLLAEGCEVTAEVSNSNTVNWTHTMKKMEKDLQTKFYKYYEATDRKHR